MADALDCGIVRIALQGSGSGYFREFSGYAFPIEKSDHVPETRHKDIVHQGPGTGDVGWAIHTDGSLRCRRRVVVPQLADLREEILREFHFSHFFCASRWQKKCTIIFVASIIRVG